MMTWGGQPGQCLRCRSSWAIAVRGYRAYSGCHGSRGQLFGEQLMHVAGACKKHVWKSDLAHPNSIAFLPVLETSLQINQSLRTQILYTLDDKSLCGCICVIINKLEQSKLKQYLSVCTDYADLDSLQNCRICF